MIGCVCPGDTLTYECTDTGRYYRETIWRGTAFECPAGGSLIILRHSHFTSVNGTSGSCNNGDIVARSLSVEGNNYTSQLNVTVTPDIAGMTIWCLSGNGFIRKLIFSSVIPAITGLSPCTETQRQFLAVLVLSLVSYVINRYMYSMPCVFHFSWGKAFGHNGGRIVQDKIPQTYHY